jgi:DNA-binding IclR family transcriptional regulator
MFKGASSRIILAHQPLRRLRKLYDEHADAVRTNGDGATWDEFRAAMATLRKAGNAVSVGEVDRGRIGVAVALLDDARYPTGSLSYVVPESVEQSTISLLAGVLTAAAREITESLRSDQLNQMLSKPVPAARRSASE